MSEKMIMEVFTSGCSNCVATMRLIQDLALTDCQVIEYNIVSGNNEVAAQKAVQYGVRSTPSVVINGKLTIVGKPTKDQLIAATLK